MAFISLLALVWGYSIRKRTFTSHWKKLGPKYRWIFPMGSVTSGRNCDTFFTGLNYKSALYKAPFTHSNWIKLRIPTGCDWPLRHTTRRLPPMGGGRNGKVQEQSNRRPRIPAWKIWCVYVGVQCRNPKLIPKVPTWTTLRAPPQNVFRWRQNPRTPFRSGTCAGKQWWLVRS